MMRIDPAEVWVDVRIWHEAETVLREFLATVVALVGPDPEGTEPIGEMDGLISLSLREGSLREAADDVDTDSELLGRVADDIMQVLPRGAVTSAVRINVPLLKPPYRGQGLLGRMVDGLLDTLQLNPSTTLVMVHPEPQREEGGPMEFGPARDQALSHIRRHYDSQGFAQWEDTVVWWRPIGGVVS